MSKYPTLYMMIGLPASGKSYLAEQIKDSTIYSSDKLREELYGDVENQEYNTKLFVELHRRIKNNLRDGNNTVYDATSISKKRRVAFLRELVNIPCKKVAVCMMTTYETCLKRNKIRDRNVPEEVIKRMYMNWCPPDYSEGFDEIALIYTNGYEDYTFENLFFGKTSLDEFNQENSHHSLTLGKHCRAAEKYLRENSTNAMPNKDLRIAALLHDCGKPFCKTKLNSKGEEDTNYHYYQHHCCGAYDSLFYTESMKLQTDTQIKIANLIYYHMHPYLSWKQSDKAKRKDIALIGEEMYEDIMLLHEADVVAH